MINMIEEPEKEKDGEEPKEEGQETNEAKPSVIEEAKEITKGLKEHIGEYKTLVERQERVAAHNMLGGTTEAGQPSKEPEEESPQDYAKRMMGIVK